jgi:hypothetical protein
MRFCNLFPDADGPPIFVVAILQVTGIWNDFPFGVILHQTQATYLMTVQLNNIVNSVQGSKNTTPWRRPVDHLVPSSHLFCLCKLFVRGAQPLAQLKADKLMTNSVEIKRSRPEFWIRQSPQTTSTSTSRKVNSSCCSVYLRKIDTS